MGSASPDWVVINKAEPSDNGIAEVGYVLLNVYSKPTNPVLSSIPIVEYAPWTGAEYQPPPISPFVVLLNTLYCNLISLSKLGKTTF